MTVAATKSKAHLGVKRRCEACSTPFYDMHRSPIQCPKCGALFRVRAVMPASPVRRPKTGVRRAAYDRFRTPERIDAVQQPNSVEPEERDEDGAAPILDAEDDETASDEAVSDKE